MPNASKRYDITQCVFYKLKSKQLLAKHLKVNINQLIHIESIIKYQEFNHKQEGKKSRLITAPVPELKRVQKRVHQLLFRLQRPEWLISGERGKSYIDNAVTHQKSKYVFTTDIRSFYSNTKREYVYRFFVDEMMMSRDTAKIMSDILTYNKSVPTGSPASQLIAYYAYRNMFQDIQTFAQKVHGCIFTLYVDDMTFSKETPFNKDQLKQGIDIILRRYGHRPKYCKTRYYSKNQNKLITGVVLSKKQTLLISNSLQQKIKTDSLLVLEKGSESGKHKLQSLKGRLQAAKLVRARAFLELTKFTNAALRSANESEKHAKFIRISSSKNTTLTS